MMDDVETISAVIAVTYLERTKEMSKCEVDGEKMSDRFLISILCRLCTV
jgi:hypothetical protein